MKKEYEKPEGIIVSLDIQESLADGDGFIDGELGLESSIF